jgi:sirohydrochlorin ferrochelatase
VGDRDRYRRALREVVAGFERRDEHLTGVAIADTALVLERLAEGRGMAAELSSPLLPRP